MAGDFTLLTRAGLNVDAAVFLARAASVAYSADAPVQAWTKAQGFAHTECFDFDNVQGYWCAGGNVAMLVFRGTSNPGQWLRDVRFFPGNHPWGHVHVGFLTGVASVESGLLAFDQAAQQAEHVWVTGHSLGGALALIAAARLKIKGITPTVYTYGQPAVGLGDFAERFSVELPQQLWRFVNQADIVTRVPPGPLFRHTGIIKRIVRPGVLESMAALEAVTTLEAAPLALGTVAPTQVVKNIVAGGAALESANVVAGAAISGPLIIDVETPPLTDLEFNQLQRALEATRAPELEGPTLEGVLSWFSDHAITEYICLLEEIRSARV